MKKLFILILMAVVFNVSSKDKLYFEDDGNLLKKPTTCNGSAYSVAYKPNKYKLFIDCGMNDNFEYYSEVKRDYVLNIDNESVIVLLVEKSLREVKRQPKFLPRSATDNFVIMMSGSRWYTILIPVEQKPIIVDENVVNVNAPQIFGIFIISICVVFIKLRK